MKTINKQSLIKALISSLFICFALTTVALASVDENPVNTLITDINSTEKDIEMENWMLNLGEWNNEATGIDTINNNQTKTTKNQEKESTKQIQSDIQSSEVEKEIEVENWMIELSIW